MRQAMRLTTWCAVLMMLGATAMAQDAPGADQPASDAPQTTETQPAETQPADTPREKVEEAVDKAEEKVKEYADKVDRSERAQEITAGILQPIYDLAERFAFPAFHWIAFALMATGVVGWGLQLVLGKLVVLTRGGFSVSEIISDAVVLIISVVGLVLTTQAAAENSTFTQSAASVLSATGTGVVVGFILYWWGQRQELEAVKGRTKAAAKKDE